MFSDGPTTQAASALTRNQAARRERVIRAALELAAEGGYDVVQMRDVAARAQVALGTIYRYFPSKDALLLAVMVQWLGDLEQRGDAAATGGRRHGRPGHGRARAGAAVDGPRPKLTAAVIAAMTAGDPASVARSGT